MSPCTQGWPHPWLFACMLFAMPLLPEGHWPYACTSLASHTPCAAGLVEELVDCSGGEEVSLESGAARKMEALGKSLGAHTADR